MLPGLTPSTHTVTSQRAIRILDDTTVLGLVERDSGLPVIMSNAHFSQVYGDRHQVQDEMKKENS